MNSISTRTLNELEKKLCNENTGKCEITISAALTAENEEYWTYSGEGIDENGDAFRHAVWCALMAKNADSSWALKFSTAHEEGDLSNDPLSKKMDLHNNSIGIKIGEDNKDKSDLEIIDLVEKAVDRGEALRKVAGKLVPTNDQGKEDYNIFKAILKKFIRMIIKLSQNATNLNSRDLDGRTPLMIACSIGDIEILKIVLNFESIDVNLVDHYGENALMIAVTNKHTKVVKLLLDQMKIDLDFRRLHDHKTALMLAAASNQKEIVIMLISDGKSDRSIKDKNGFTAYDHARMENHQSLLDILRIS